MEYEKTEDGRLMVRQEVIEMRECTYDLTELKMERGNLERQRDAEYEAKTARMKELDALIAEAEKAGCVERAEMT